MARHADSEASYRYGRWSAWLREALKRNGISKSAVARLVGSGVSASLVSRWLAGEAAPTANRTFALGQDLLRRGDRSASGPIALFSAGYYAELIRMLSALGQLDGGGASAVITCVTLPRSLSWLPFQDPAHFQTQFFSTVPEPKESGVSKDEHRALHHPTPENVASPALEQAANATLFDVAYELANRSRVPQSEAETIADGAARIAEWRIDPVTTVSVVWPMLFQWALRVDARALLKHSRSTDGGRDIAFVYPNPLLAIQRYAEQAAVAANEVS